MQKQEILDAIRDMQDNGIGPGQRRFTRVTGIPSTYWKGYYWTKWTEAVVEAGLKPRTVKHRITREQLLAQMVERTRHYGRLPTDAEITYDARCGSNAWPRTFTRELGTRTEMALAMRQYCEADPALQDVIPMIRGRTEEDVDPPRPPAPELPQKWQQLALGGGGREAVRRRFPPWATGVVYMLRSDSYFKIGRSLNLSQRLDVIASNSPHPVRVVHVIATDDPAGIEAYWHRRFASRRTKREWFQLDPREVVEFRRRESM